MISYADLLQIFWETHDPSNLPYARQYRSVILAQNDEQKQIAMISKQAWEQKSGRSVYTVVEALQFFTLAENYHQKYYLRQRSSLMHDLLLAFPIDADFINATLSARLNAIAAGFDSLALLEEVLNNPLLSEKTKDRLTRNKQKVR